MKPRNGTDKVIMEMVHSPSVKALSARERYFFRESLLNLVRLAKAEQMMEMRLNVRRLTAPAAQGGARQSSRGARRDGVAEPVQHQLQFY